MATGLILVRSRPAAARRAHDREGRYSRRPGIPAATSLLRLRSRLPSRRANNPKRRVRVRPPPGAEGPTPATDYPASGGTIADRWTVVGAVAPTRFGPYQFANRESGPYGTLPA